MVRLHQPPSGTARNFQLERPPKTSKPNASGKFPKDIHSLARKPLVFTIYSGKIDEELGNELIRQTLTLW